MENNNAYNGEDLQGTWVILDLKHTRSLAG
jgi:hypothetical protein